MLNKEIKNKLLKISPENFIQYLEKRGNTYNEELKKKLYDIDNESKQSKIQINQLYEKYNITTNIADLIDLFKILNDYNINYINYVLIYDNLNIQQFKNIYRYLMIKWNKVKNNLIDIHGKNDVTGNIENFIFQDIIEEINKENNYENIKKLVTNKIKNFVFINNNEFPNIYIIFFINTLQEYLYPI